MTPGRHRRAPTPRETLERAINRACFWFVLTIVALLVWHYWPTDGTAPPYLPTYRFHLRF